jgi:anti-sigma factor RsiW
VSTCAKHTAFIQPYLDGESTEAEEQSLFSHLEACPGCRREMEELKALSNRLSQARPLMMAPVSLRLRITELTAAHEKKATAERPIWSNVSFIDDKARSRATWIPALIAAVLCLAFGISFWTIHLRPQAAAANFVETAVSTHQRLMNVNMPLGVSSDSLGTISSWFSTRVPFTFRMPSGGIAAQDLAKYKVVGGRLVTFAGEPAASLVFQLNNEPVSVLVASGKNARAIGGVVTHSNGITFHTANRADLHIVTWENSQLVYALIFSNKASQNGNCSSCHESRLAEMTARLNTPPL